MSGLRALMVILLVLNGARTAPAAAIHVPMAADQASHAGHHPAGPATDAAHEHDAAPQAGGDCCDDISCDCGCAVPQVATSPADVPRGTWPTALPGFAFVVKAFHSGPNNTPFRPPA